MPPTFLYKADPARGRQWAEVFLREAPEIDFRIWPEVGDPLEVQYLAAWEPPSDIAERRKGDRTAHPPGLTMAPSLHSS